jgi:hypothetical protein
MNLSGLNLDQVICCLVLRFIRDMSERCLHVGHNNRLFPPPASSKHTFNWHALLWILCEQIIDVSDLEWTVFAPRNPICGLHESVRLFPYPTTDASPLSDLSHVYWRTALVLTALNHFVVRAQSWFWSLCSVDRAPQYNSCKWPTWRTILFSINLFQFSTCFEQLCAHH